MKFAMQMKIVTYFNVRNQFQFLLNLILLEPLQLVDRQHTQHSSEIAIILPW